MNEIHLECPLCEWRSDAWTAETEFTMRRLAADEWHGHVRKRHTPSPRFVENTPASTTNREAEEGT